MEKIAGNKHHIGCSRKDAIHGRAKSLGDVSFALVDSASGLPMVLPETEMRIRNVGEFHRWRMKRSKRKIKQLHDGRACPPWRSHLS
jgi:hypothetical protein